MELILVRHGEAGTADLKRFPNDALRPLTDKGRKQFKRAALGLAALDLSEARIFASPALRARATAEILAKACGQDPAAIILLRELAMETDPVKSLPGLNLALTVARGKKSTPEHPIVLVGHEPWLGEFASLLIFGKRGGGLKLAKGGACKLEADRLTPGRGRLLWWMGPDQLRTLA